jgi:glucan phosphoethanolaminetransferase (alkaline phosphatase superfamily)
MKWKSKLSELLFSSIGGYIIALILDRVVFINWREEISSTSSNLHIDRPGSSWRLSIYYILLALIVTVLFVLLLKWIRRRRSTLKKVLLGLVGFIVLICLFYIFLSSFIPIAQVDYKMEISGWVKDTSSYAYLFVRPLSMGTGQIWLQDPAPLQPDSFGKWRTLAWFGGISGTRYEIIVILSSLRIERFSLSGAYDFKDIPHGTERFVRVVEHR